MNADDTDAIRREVDAVADRLAKLHLVSAEPANDHELSANMELAYRHLEDASMRLDLATMRLNGTHKMQVKA